MLDDSKKNMQSTKKLQEGKIVEKDRVIGINSSLGWSEEPILIWYHILSYKVLDCTLYFSLSLSSSLVGGVPSPFL